MQKNIDENLTEDNIKDIQENLNMILNYTQKAKENGVSLTEADGLDKSIVTFLNHTNNICLSKENFYNEIATIFGYYPDEISFKENWKNTSFSNIFCKTDFIYAFRNFQFFPNYFNEDNFNENQEIKAEIPAYGLDLKKLKEEIPKILMTWIQSTQYDLRESSFPQIAGATIFLTNAINIENVTFPVVALNGLYMNQVRNITNTTCPKIIFGGFFMGNVESVNNVTWPVYVEGDFDLGNIKNGADITFPKQIIDGSIFGGMINVDYLKLSEYVDGEVYFDELIYAKNLVLPLHAQAVHLESKETSLGLIIPDPLTYTIYGKGFTITPENVHLYRNNQPSLKRERKNNNKI